MDFILNFKLVDDFLKRKLDYGLSKNTLKVNACALEKFFTAVNRRDITGEIVNNFSEYYEKAGAAAKPIPFENPTAVIANMKQEGNRTLGGLQHKTGCRIGDTKKIQPNIDTNAVFIVGSKGGRDRIIDYSDRQTAFDRIVELKKELDRAIAEQGWDCIRKNYYPDLRAAVKKSGEIYCGAHAFRASYVEERWNELIEVKHMEEREAEKIITLELGHSRPSMTRYYML